MACAASNNPNAICVSYDGSTWTFDPDTLDWNDSNSTILLQRDGNGWTFESFEWIDEPPAGNFSTPVVTPATITLTDADTAAGEWHYKVCVNYNGRSVCSDPKIVNLG